MRYFSKPALTSILIVASFASVAMTTTPLLDSVTTLFGRTHIAAGDATLTQLPGGELLVSPNSNAPAGISIPLTEVLNGEASTLNVIFDPIMIEVGESFSKELISSSGDVLATFRYEQVSTNETDVYMLLDDAVEGLETVRVRTYADGAMTAESSVSTTTTKIGTVESVDQAWMKTYHWICDEYGCDLLTDPANTTIRFSDNPDVAVPFVYLAFGFGENETFRNAASVRLTGTSAFTIVDENNDNLNLIY